MKKKKEKEFAPEKRTCTCGHVYWTREGHSIICPGCHRPFGQKYTYIEGEGPRKKKSN